MLEKDLLHLDTAGDHKYHDKVHLVTTLIIQKMDKVKKEAQYYDCLTLLLTGKNGPM